MAPPGYAGEGSWQPAAFGIDYHLSAVKCISSLHRCRTLGHGSVPESVHSPQFGSCTECELLGLYHSAPCLLMSPKKPVRCETVFTYKPAENQGSGTCGTRLLRLDPEPVDDSHGNECRQLYVTRGPTVVQRGKNGHEAVLLFTSGYNKSVHLVAASRKIQSRHFF